MHEIVEYELAKQIADKLNDHQRFVFVAEARLHQKHGRNMKYDDHQLIKNGVKTPLGECLHSILEP